MISSSSLHQRVYPYHSGGRWQTLVERVMGLRPADPLRIALALTIDRHNRNLPDSAERLHPDCPVCAARLLSEFGGSEQELIRLFYHHVAEVKQAMQHMSSRHRKKLVA